ncbi:transmembrane protein, putative [Medicago truncatula]|uniref:Transmembrane protein, putative n=1 Tax=Medicago truncatula TaxID=3880 RepID=A0A072VKB2_MEDTR|nr:transmembrane protein, putative [Medicago truncatula]
MTLGDQQLPSSCWRDDHHTDDVACLLDIPVAGRLIHEEDLDHDHVVDLLVTHLLFPAEDAVGQVSDFGASVTFTALKDRYDHLLNRCNHLLGEDLSEEKVEQELSRIRPACVKAFLLLLSWGVMGLAFLYDQLNLTSDSNVGSVGGYMSLVVICLFVFAGMGYNSLQTSRSEVEISRLRTEELNSGSIMASKQRMVRHLPERVLRQYRHVQRVPRPPTTVMPLALVDVVAAFLEFALHVVPQQQRGGQISEDEPWKHSGTYIRWFYRVSHPLIVDPAPAPDRVKHAMQIPEVVSNPLFFDILEGLWTDYSVFDHQHVPRTRSRSHIPQE